MEYSNESLFCARYLALRGYTSKDFDELVAQSDNLEGEYALVKKEVSDFYRELAEKLRDLWPRGDKNGKYPWRDSVDNLRRRLINLWNTRLKGQTYTIDECLTVARKYLSQFQDDTTYMQILKYFILNDKKKTSRFADMLENQKESIPEDDWIAEDNVFNEEGVLI